MYRFFCIALISNRMHPVRAGDTGGPIGKVPVEPLHPALRTWGARSTGQKMSWTNHVAIIVMSCISVIISKCERIACMLMVMPWSPLYRPGELWRVLSIEHSQAMWCPGSKGTGAWGSAVLSNTCPWIQSNQHKYAIIAISIYASTWFVWSILSCILTDKDLDMQVKQMWEDDAA